MGSHFLACCMAGGQYGNRAGDTFSISCSPCFSGFFQLVWTADFWQAVGFSLIRIAGGFFCAVIAGVIFAGLSARWQWFGQLLSPAILTIKAIPVASFIILVLIWISSKNLSILISFLMVLPIIYTNVLDGIGAVDKNLLEMAEVFQVPAGRRLRYIYISQVLPFFRSGCSIALGLCWKSGIAAEVIGIPDHSIGEHLYNAKVYLDTPDLFAWTLVIVLISIAFEKIVFNCFRCSCSIYGKDGIIWQSKSDICIKVTAARKFWKISGCT